MQKVSSIGFHLHPAFPMYCVYRNPWCSFAVPRFFLSFLFVSDRLLLCSSLFHVGYLLLFLYIFPKHDVLSLLHDSCFLYIWISVDIFTLISTAFIFSVSIPVCCTVSSVESDFSGQIRVNHSIHHKHIHIS